jgi:hypothetical protein
MYAAGTSPEYVAKNPDSIPAWRPLEKMQGNSEPPGWKYPSKVPQRPPQGSAFPPAPASPPQQPQDVSDVSSWLSTLQPEDMSFLRQLIAAVREAQGRDSKQAQQPPVPGSPPVANAPQVRANPAEDVKKQPGQWVY